MSTSLIDQLTTLSVEAENLDVFCENAVDLIEQSNPKFDWVGIYRADENLLTLPERFYQGTEPDHKEIPFDEGICGAAARERATIVVDDVNSDPRYLACSLYTQSEIVVPIIAGETLYGVLDLDSDTPAAFGSVEQQTLESAAEIIAGIFQKHR